MRKQAFYLAAAVLVVAGAAWAGTYGTVDMTYQNNRFPDKDGVDALTAVIHKPGAITDGKLCYVGRSNFYVNGAVDGVLDNPFIVRAYVGKYITAYCVDVYQWVDSGLQTWHVDPLSSAPVGSDNGPTPSPMGDAKARLLAELSNKYLDLVNDGNVALAAAFQAAVWEIVNEPVPTSSALSYDVTSGSFWLGTTNGFTATANTWLRGLTIKYDADGNMIGGADHLGVDYGLLSFTTQDFALLAVGVGGSQPVIPEPLTMVSAFLAIGGLGMYVRRRMRVPGAAA